MEYELNSVMHKDAEQQDLYKTYTIIRGVEKVSVVAGIDGGSTATRVSLVTSDELQNSPAKLFEQFVIPSDFAGEFDSNTTIKAQSSQLIDNLDSYITPLDNSDVICKTRILRGTKLSDGNKELRKISSSEQKIDSSNFYYNVIDALGYAIIRKFSNNVPVEVDVYASVSLRPDDVDSDRSQKLFKQRLMGSYVWENKELHVTFKINILGVTVTSESEAEVKGHYIRSREKTPYCVMLVEGGGSSIGISIVKNGKMIKMAERTLPYGGTQLLKMVDREYRNMNGGSNLREEMLNYLVRHGCNKIGSLKTSGVKAIISAKKQFAAKIVKDIINDVFDSQTEVSLPEVETVLYGGRLFDAGDFGVYSADSEEVRDGGYSLAVPLSTLLKEKNPGLKFITTAGNQIPFGNLIIAVKAFGGRLQ